MEIYILLYIVYNSREFRARIENNFRQYNIIAVYRYKGDIEFDYTLRAPRGGKNWKMEKSAFYEERNRQLERTGIYSDFPARQYMQHDYHRPRACYIPQLNLDFSQLMRRVYTRNISYWILITIAISQKARWWCIARLRHENRSAAFSWKTTTRSPSWCYNVYTHI